MADNKDKKVLKSSIERELSQTCLNSAEREKIKGSTNLNVPHLRFPEFTEGWEEVTLKEVADFQKDRVSTELLNESTYISTENIQQNFGGIQLANTVPTNANVIAYNKNDILLSNIRPYLKKVWLADRNGGCSADVFVLRSRCCEQSFLYNVIASDRFIGYVMSGAKGVKMPRGDKKQMENFKFSLPSVIEQRKISRLLSLLDERIATQNKIIEDLKLLKSAIAETVFNNMKGHLTNLSAICSIVKGKQVNGEELSEKGKYYVMNGGITPSGYYDQCNTPANTISISEGGNSCGYVQYNKSSFWSGGHCYTLQDISSGVETQYLFHYLKRYESNIMKLRIGTGLPNIQKKDLENFRIVLPPSNVQKEIATCLTAIEHKILVEINWLDSVQKEKQHLLHQMFI